MVAPLTHSYLQQITGQTDARQLAITMAMSYIKDAEKNSYSRTISVGDISKIEHVALRTNEFASAIRSHILDSGFSIWSLLKGNIVQRFDDGNPGQSNVRPEAGVQCVRGFGPPPMTGKL